MTLDMTRGKPIRLMARFALPLMLSMMLQQLYGVFDSVIVGRMLGADAFAAVGTSANLNWFPLSMLSGLTQGFGVLVGRRFGAGDEDGVRRAIASSIVMALICGVILSVVGVNLLNPFLTLLKTPDELMAHSEAYMRVIWFGLALTALYNAVGSALTALGDSRTPFMALCCATALNIALDYLFIGAFKTGVEGAALATLLSQAAALCFCSLKLFRLRVARLTRDDFKPEAQTIRKLLRLGVPLLVSRSVISIGSLTVQAAVNSFGVAFVTGTTAAFRYFSLLIIVCNSLEASLATFVAQNSGAGHDARVLSGTRTAVRLGLISSAILTTAVCLLARQLISVFLPDAGGEALKIGIDQLRIEAAFLFLLHLLCLYRAAIQGMGNSVIPMLSGFIELAARLAAAFALPALFGREGLYFTDAVAWFSAAVMLCACYFVRARRLNKAISDASVI